MKKFQFKFSSILRLRKTREEQALRSLGEAQRAHQAELRDKARLVGELHGALDRRERLGGDEISILALRTEQDFIDGTRQRIVRADQAIMRASRAVEKAMRAYLHARRQTRMLETLYERHHEQFKRDRAKREQRAMDDLTVMRSHLAGEDSEEIA